MFSFEIQEIELARKDAYAVMLAMMDCGELEGANEVRGNGIGDEESSGGA